ncbi:MAG: CBS domain-containing protein [Candidatus Omnitrophica bacterium]|nr:CBS domain-containing protein [Candidatus Omnitrophota bacterium]
MPLIVKDFMSKRIKSIPPDMNARDALKLLIKSGASGLPVIDKNGRLYGVFTEKEVLKVMSPAYLKHVGAFVYGGESRGKLKKIAQLAKRKVRDVMRKDVPTVDEDTSITEVSRIMLTRSERRIVVTKGFKAIGVITRSDIVKALAKEAGLAL